MSPRTTGILFLVALALGAFVYFYEIRGEEARKAAEEAEKEVFPGVEEGEIEAVELATAGGTPARLVRRGDGWMLVEPLEFPADEFAVEGMTSALAGLVGEEVLEDPQPPEVYGLGEEERRGVRFRTGEGEHELRIGKHTPVGSNTYVARSDEPGRIYVVATYRVNGFRRSLDELRDKQVLGFDPGSIARIEARWPEGHVVVERRPAGAAGDAAEGGADAGAGEEAATDTGAEAGADAPDAGEINGREDAADAWEADGAWGDWRLVEPLQTRADETTVESLLDTLERLRATGFVDDPPSDAEVGLDTPGFEVILRTAPEAEGEQPVRFRLAVGGTVDGSRVVRAGQPSLYKIDPAALEDLPRSVVAYRWKRLSEFDVSDAERFEVLFRGPGVPEEGYTLTGRRNEDGGWETQPDPLRPGMAFGMLSELSDLRASDIAAESMGPDELEALGLSPPRVTLRVYGEAPEEAEAPVLAELHLGRPDPDPGRGIPARVPGRDSVYRLDRDRMQSLPAGFEGYQNRFVSEEPPE